VIRLRSSGSRTPRQLIDRVEGSISTRVRSSPAGRVGRLFVRRLRDRSTLIFILLVTLMLGLAVATIRSGISMGAIIGSESTDDAYVRGDQIVLSSHIAGYIESIPVRDNETVKRGQLIATIRDDDYRAKVKSARASLAVARSQVDILSARIMVQTQKIASASAEVLSVQALLKQARLQRARQRELVEDGTTSRRELESAEADEGRLRSSREQKVADLGVARQSLQVIRAQSLAAQQSVQAAEATLELAYIDLGYTHIVSPTDGQLSERGSLAGEYVTAGTRIGLLVPLPDVWIVANFRESQLAHMRPGQSVRITVDSVPGTSFRGTVESFGPASGALQALLPPDNATGNFTKVAQRFAVKVVFAPGQSSIERLRPGMSASVAVGVGGTSQERNSGR
jgi:membrane fusion protein (multidrug efflux system)